MTELTEHPAMPVTKACRLVGLPRSTYYRIHRGYQHYQPVAVVTPARDRHQPASLSQAERDQITELMERKEYQDLSAYQIYWRCVDAGLIACSQRTWYRVATDALLTGDRRRTRRGGHGRPKPCVTADRPNQLWSWDATELAGPERQRYKLILILDVYSRYPIGWRIDHHESIAGAKELFTTAIDQHGVPDIVHSDNGGVMRAHDLVDLLHTQGAATSYSRPRVSNDNPFSESMFKTIKYDLNCPAGFDSIEQARAWTAEFLDNYATQHRHSGLANHTPANAYHGTTDIVTRQRQNQLDRYHAEHPERFRKPPKAANIKPTGINLSQTG